MEKRLKGYKMVRTGSERLRLPITILAALVLGFALLGSFTSHAARSQQDQSAQVAVNATNGHITYSSARNGPYNLFTRNADGSNEVTFLGGSPFFFLTPAYSPDGTKLAFASDRDTFDNFELYVVDIDPVLGTAKLNTIQRLTTSNQANVFPTWSPDGTRIAFMRGTLGSLHALDMGNTNTQIYIIPAAGGAPTLFSNNVTSYVTPAWSPGTSQNVLAFARKSASSGKYFIETAVVNNDNTMGQILGLMNSDVNSTTPVWSPDATKIAFVSDRNDPLGDIWTMTAQPDAQKTFPNQRRFTTGAERDILPAWSPDGTKLVWSRGASGSTDTATLDIWMQNVDASGAATGNATNVTNSNGEDSQPTWQPAAASPSPSPSPGGPTDLSLAVSVSPNPGYAKGNYTYTVAITNKGPNDANGFDLQAGAGWPLISADAQCKDVSGQGDISCSPLSVASGKTLTVHFTVRPTAATTNHPVQVKLQGVNNTTPANNVVNFTENILPAQTDIGLAVTGPSTVQAGAKFDYQVTVTNYGPSQATGAKVGFNLPQGVTFSSADQTNNTCTNLAAGSFSFVCPVNTTLEAAPATGSTSTFNVSLRAQQGGTFDTSAVVSNVDPEPSTDPHPNTVKITTKADAFPDLAITNLSVVPNPVAEGKATVFQVAVKNNSTVITATGVKLTHQLGQSEFFDGYGVSGSDSSITGTCTSNKVVVTCNLSNLPPGKDATVALQLRFQNGKAPNAGRAAFTVSSNETDANPADNTSEITATVTVPNAPSNDNVIGAVMLPGVRGTLDGQNNVGATMQANLCKSANCRIPEPKHAGRIGGRSVWYFWTAPDNGNIVLSTNVNSFDTLVAVYRLNEDGTGLIGVDANDDVDSSSNRSEVHFTAYKNTVYLIAVDGYNGASGNFALIWDLAVFQPEPTPARVTAICSGNKPNCDPEHVADDRVSSMCTADSAALSFCQQFVDLNGFRLLTVKGVNFTKNSFVLINSKRLEGMDLTGKPINGSTDFIDSQTLVAHIPPLPQLDAPRLNTVQVIELLGPLSPNGPQAGDLAPGRYRLADNIALQNVIQLKNAVIPPGEKRKVCGNLQDFGLNKINEETCIEFDNNPAFYPDPSKVGPQTVTPAWFAINAYCQAHTTNSTDFFKCTGLGTGPERLTQLMQNGFSVNVSPGTGSVLGGKISVIQTFPIPNAAELAAKGAAIVAQGGGNIVAQGGGNIVAQGGGNIVAQGGGNIVAQGGGNIVAQGGGNIVAQGGGNIVAQGGGNFISGNGSAAATRDSSSGGDPSSKGQGTGKLTATDLQNGSRGWFIVSSSGGNAPSLATTTNLDGTVTGTISATFDNTSNPRIDNVNGLAFTVVVTPGIVQLANSNITADEGSGRATVKLTRTGDTSTVVTVNYATANGSATERTDFMPVFGEVTFAADETQKDITIPLIDNGYTSSGGTFTLTIGNAVGGAIQMPNVATISITNNDTANPPANSADDSRFFVRQHYMDFLTREPEQGGWDYWTNELSKCGSDQACIRSRRIGVSAAFFIEQEFQQTGFFVYRTYKATFGQRPGYAPYILDHARIGQGTNTDKAGYVGMFVMRPEFIAKYPLSQDGPAFVDALIANVKQGSNLGLTHKRAELLTEYNLGVTQPEARAAVLLKVLEYDEFKQAEFNSAFVASAYFGYLRRDPEQAGYDFWLNILNNKLPQDSSGYRSMVCAFITSREYQERFATAVTHTNQECGNSP
jgi:uncharacterized repeat protein (TIGR01451 family)